jgi:hypothetical protein
MEKNESRFIKLTSMLIRLTQQGLINWEYHSDVNNYPKFIVEFEGQYLCIAKRNIRVENYDEMKKYDSNFFAAYLSNSFPMTLIKAELEITNKRGNLIWAFPYNTGLEDLYEIVQLNVANLDGLMNKIMNIN